jgi:hypothetical protein
MRSKPPRVCHAFLFFLFFSFRSIVDSYLTKLCKNRSEADERGDGAEAMGMGKMFSDPGMFAKLAANPRTAKHLADASFMQKVCKRRSRADFSSSTGGTPRAYYCSLSFPAPAHTAEPATGARPA